MGTTALAESHVMSITHLWAWEVSDLRLSNHNPVPPPRVHNRVLRKSLGGRGREGSFGVPAIGSYPPSWERVRVWLHRVDLRRCIQNRWPGCFRGRQALSVDSAPLSSWSSSVLLMQARSIFESEVRHTIVSDSRPGTKYSEQILWNSRSPNW